MSSEKRSGVPQKKEDGPKDTSQKRVTDASIATAKPLKLSQPTLDDKQKFLLDGKKDKVDDLYRITVNFYPGGFQETTYDLREGGGIRTLSTHEFLEYQFHKKEEETKKNEITAAKGFVTKLWKRTLLSLGDDRPGNVRRAQALEFPLPADRVLGYTQEQMKLKGLNEFHSVLNHWCKMPRDVFEKMDGFQRELDPGAETSWSENLAFEVQRHNDELEEAARKKALKGAPKAPKAGIGLKEPTTEPKEEIDEERDEEESSSPDREEEDEEEEPTNNAETHIGKDPDPKKAANTTPTKKVGGMLTKVMFAVAGVAKPPNARGEQKKEETEPTAKERSFSIL